MAGMTLTPAEVVTRFNDVVRTAAVNLSAATYFAGNLPNSSGDPRLGPRAEVLHVEADLAAKGALTASVVYNILHHWAMELTRVRSIRAIYGVQGEPLNTSIADVSIKNVVVTSGIAALNTNLCLYFPIPSQPIVGDVINDANMNTFLVSLRDAVNGIRTSTSADRIFDIYSCHSNCHNNCHSSRSRR